MQMLELKRFQIVIVYAIVVSIDCVAFGCFSGDCASQTLDLVQPRWGVSLPFLRDQGPVCLKGASVFLDHIGGVEQASSQGYHNKFLSLIISQSVCLHMMKVVFCILRFKTQSPRVSRLSWKRNLVVRCIL
jgi:hypothetical protein